MKLATIEPHIIRKSTPRFTKSPSLVFMRQVFTAIQRFKNSKIYLRNVKPSGRFVGQRPDGHTFLCKFWHFQMAVSYYKVYLHQTWGFCKHNLLCGSTVANPIIYRLVRSPSRFEIRQWGSVCGWGLYCFY